METKTVVFKFADGSSKTFKMSDRLYGLRDSNGHRPIEAIFNFKKEAELTKVELENLCCVIMISLDPINGVMTYE